MIPQEQEAIRRILAGNREEYRFLMERHLPQVLRMTLRVTGNLDDAEEAAQEAFLQAYKSLATFREQASFGTWVYRIAMNRALNLIKRRDRTPEWNAEALDTMPQAQVAACTGLTPEAALLNAEAAQQRERAMQQLTPMERTAFVLRHMEEQPIDVIAGALGINCNAARQALFRAVSKLRRELDPARNDSRTAFSSSAVLREQP